MGVDVIVVGDWMDLGFVFEVVKCVGEDDLVMVFVEGVVV